MKRILLAITILILVLPAVRRADAADVSVDFFYNNLNDGNWIEVGDYGYGWQPNAASNRNWRPYADGYWAYTDVGWTWVSYEDFGWATYHYGRWARIADQGWVWFPGNDLEWGPAWVSWRTGGDYIGWAPLPPRGGQVVYEGRPITGHVDVEFDIGPAYYNFVDVRYIGEPVLRERLFESSQNVTYINKTVNVTNITYNNSVVYNYGPDYETVNRYSTRPVQRLQLERQTNVDFSVAMTSGGTKVQGQKLVVSAPLRIERPATPIAPKVVKMKVEQTKVEHGWQGLGDPKAQAQLKEKMKTEDAKSVAPPTVQPRAGAGANASAASASPAPSASTSVGAGSTSAASVSPAMSPFGKGKGKRNGVESNVSPSPSASVAGGAAPMEPTQGNGRKGKGAGAERTAPAMTPAVSATPAEPSGAMTPMEGGKGRKGKHGQAMPGGTPAMSESPSGGTQSAVPMERGRKGKHGDQTIPGGTPAMSASPSGSTESAVPMERGRKGKHGDQTMPGGPPAMSASPSGSTESAVPMERGRKGKRNEPSAPTNSLNEMGPTSNAGTGENTSEPGRGKHNAERSDLNGPASTTGSTAAPSAVTAPEQHRKAQQVPSENAAGGPAQGEKGKGKKKEEVSPTPGPQ